VQIDDDGIRASRGTAERLALEIQGRRVWSFVPARDGRRVAEGEYLVAWPAGLRPHLNGRADLTVRSLETQEVLHEQAVTLGDGEGVVRLVDGRGRPVAVAKQNQVTSAMFADATEHERGLLVDAVVEALDFMADRGHDAFLAYGNLLGAVRDGALIGHDDDADIAYLARATHPFDIIVESLRIEREFRRAGWSTTRMSGGTFKLWARLPDGLKIGIDVFTAFYYGDRLHVMPYVAERLPRQAVLPLSRVVLEGRELAAPAQPETLLEATYGPGWRVPDPSFKYEPPRWLRRRITGWFRGRRRHAAYWNTFYGTKATDVPTEPSAFARWVASQDRRPTSLLDVGSGTGRDSLWFAEQGIRVLGCDYSQTGVTYATERAAQQGCSATFRRLNLYDLREMLTVGALLGHEGATDAVYARFLVHALEDEGRKNLWRFSRSVLAPTRGRIYLEFRTEATEHEFGEHFRQFVQPDVVHRELESYGFEIEHSENRHGLAVHKNEDPRVCRIVAKLKG
jgi:SAM-dependent methyltransferase